MTAREQLLVLDADLRDAANLVDLILIAAELLGRPIDAARVDQGRARDLAAELLATLGLGEQADARDARGTEDFALGEFPPRGTAGYAEIGGRHAAH